MTRPESDPTALCLLTRPAHQTGPLQQALVDGGFQVLVFPTIQIASPPASPQLEQLSDEIAQFDIVLFVSRNAVDYALQVVPREKWPSTLRLGVIGKGTSQALQNHNFEVSINPGGSFNSEGLLEAPELQHMDGLRVLVLRGQEGRNLLGDTLRQRGAQIEYREVYRRVLPEYPAGYFADLTRDHFPDIAVFTSAEGLRNCFQLIAPDAAERLRDIPWLLISDRMRETAVDLGHNASIVIASRASDEGIQKALQDWRKNKHQAHP
jgi:uroporphyrinogen-III synthase